MTIKQLLIIARDSYNFNKKRKIITDGSIVYINWWKSNLNRQWFTQYIENAIGNINQPIIFYSVFGRHNNLKGKTDAIRVFFTGENIVSRVHHDSLKEREEKVVPFDNRIKHYEKKINEYNMDLVLTFCTDGINNAIRFPYWIVSHFSDCHSLEDVRQRLFLIEDKYRSADVSRKGAAAIASHDFFGTRTFICDSLSGIIDIEYAGKWRNNTDKLWVMFKNDKKAYLSTKRFNICPENMDAKEYVTEKIWDSFDAGCIPIYNGALNNPEPRIFNREAFILWSYEGNNEEIKKKVQKLNTDDDYYIRIKNNKIFVDGADEYIYSLIDNFRIRMVDLIEKKQNS